MKKIVLVTLCAVLSFPVSAQPTRPLPQKEVFKGVVINPDNSVTFQYRNPKAARVEVSGEFMNGSADLVEKDGVWTYTTDPLDSEMYFYSLKVDGMPILDLNWSLVKDIPRWMNYFIISGDKGDIYNVQNVPHGTVASRWYHSDVLKMDRRVNIYTPAGYENGKQKLPVFYLLHGNACDENSWLDLGRAAQILDNLIARGKAVPMIVVMTNGNPAQQAAPAYFGDTYTNANTAPGIATFPESFNEVMSFVEKNYRTVNKKEGRAIAGYSMGGWHTFSIVCDHPDTFDYIGLFSAPGGDMTDSGTKEKVLNLQKKGYELYYIGCGKDDFLYQMVLNVNSHLDGMGFKYHYRETEGGHTWGPWRIFLTEMSQMLFKGKSKVDTAVSQEDNITPSNGIADVQEVLKTRTATCLAELLIGMIPGLNVYYTPDGGVSSNMRGPNSINQSTEPIVYVDGIEAGRLSEVNAFINVRDIKSIYVDKDGGIYGVKGGCGVVKIQTLGGSMSTY